LDEWASKPLPAGAYEQLRREALALAWRWQQRMRDGAPAIEGCAGVAQDAPADPGLEAASARVLAALRLLSDACARAAAPAEGARSTPSDPPCGAAVHRSWAPAGLLPDDPDVYVLLERVEHRLLQPLAAATRAATMFTDQLPVPVANGPALLAAFRAVCDAVPPLGSSRSIVGTNGRWDLIGLHVLHPPAAAMTLLQAALGEMSAALASPPLTVPQDTTLRTLMRLASRAGTTPEVLVGDLARALALLDMPADRATLELRHLLTSSPPGGIRLDHAQSGSYREFAQRVAVLVLDFDRLLPGPLDDPGGNRGGLGDG
jgi:hypothetical protein